MARARLIYRKLSKSNKYNDLYQKEHGELAQNIYQISYAFSDDWGHLPYDARWIKNECMPESVRTVDEVKEAIKCLVAVGLWRKPYSTNGKSYVYIHNFDTYQKDGIRHRRSGEYPDESGKIPKRRVKGDKPIPIDECLTESFKIRRLNRN